MPVNALKPSSWLTARWPLQTFGAPIKVQEETWPAIAVDRSVLVNAPTGAGETLPAFLVFIDRLNAMAWEGGLKEELYLIYVSPLKSLAEDIRENLRRLLDGTCQETELMGEGKMPDGPQVAIRARGTLQKDRQRMVRHPPHIPIITPGSPYLTLTSKTGQTVLRTTKAVIADELHALIDTERGAHLVLSIARLDQLCKGSLQRTGLPATIEPLDLAAAYLSPGPALTCAPVVDKQMRIQVLGTMPA